MTKDDIDDEGDTCICWVQADADVDSRLSDVRAKDAGGTNINSGRWCIKDGHLSEWHC